MRYRKLNENRDMVFGGQQGDFYRDNPEAVAQAVLTRLLLWAGEWFIDTSEGTPYQQAVLGMHTQKTAEPAIRARILETQGVTSLESFSMVRNPDTRRVTFSAEINTQYGTATVQGVL